MVYPAKTAQGIGLAFLPDPLSFLLLALYLVVEVSSRPQGEILKHIVIIKISRAARNDI
jgi:hypothetical protein